MFFAFYTWVDYVNYRVPSVVIPASRPPAIIRQRKPPGMPAHLWWPRWRPSPSGDDLRMPTRGLRRWLKRSAWVARVDLVLWYRFWVPSRHVRRPQRGNRCTWVHRTLSDDFVAATARWIRREWCHRVATLGRAAILHRRVSRVGVSWRPRMARVWIPRDRWQFAWMLRIEIQVWWMWIGVG